jgi:hypothetical protein
MSFQATAPPFPTALRADLAACALWISEVNNAGQESAHIHYPTCNPAGAQGAVDPLPAILITQDDGDIESVAEGGGMIVSGLRLDVDIYLAASTVGGTPRDVGYVEAFAATLIQQLLARQPRILPYRGRQTFGKASDPTPGAWAADDAGTSHPCAFRHIKLSLSFGYQS